MKAHRSFEPALQPEFLHDLGKLRAEAHMTRTEVIEVACGYWTMRDGTTKCARRVCKPLKYKYAFIMTNDQFETLAQMIKGVHDDLSAEIGSLSSDLQSFKLETRENFAKVFAHLTSHDRDLSMIKKEMMDQGRTLKSLAGLEMEVIETKRRVTRIEQQRDIPRPALQ